MQVQSLVNKVCPENMNTIVEKISTVEAPQRDGECSVFSVGRPKVGMSYEKGTV